MKSFQYTGTLNDSITMRTISAGGFTSNDDDEDDDDDDDDDNSLCQTQGSPWVLIALTLV
jgi:hypothetical protein